MRKVKIILTIVVIIMLFFYLITHNALFNADISPNEELTLSTMALPSENKNDSNSYEEAERYYLLGEKYSEGEKAKRNYIKALMYYIRSCELGSGIGCLEVAYMYSGGYGVPKDMKKASDYYGIACDYGYAAGCKNWNVLNGYY